jgi:hypothetical protein
VLLRQRRAGPLAASWMSAWMRRSSDGMVCGGVLSQSVA